MMKLIIAVATLVAYTTAVQPVTAATGAAAEKTKASVDNTENNKQELHIDEYRFNARLDYVREVGSRALGGVGRSAP